MLDPFTALSLASSVVQFVDYGTKLLNESAELYHSGTLLRHEDFETITKDLIEVNALLKTRPKLEESASSPSSEGEHVGCLSNRSLQWLTRALQALDKLITECSAAAEDFITCLESLKSGRTGGRWNSFREAIKTRWNVQYMNKMEKRLVAFRNELVFRILALLNAKADTQAAHLDERFDRLDKDQGDIVEVMSINQEMLRSTLRDNTNGLTQLLEESSLTAERRHDETIAAILTLKNGATRVLSRRATGIGTEIQPSDQTCEKVLTLKAGLGVLRDTEANVESFAPVQTKILDCLYFRQICDRIETVSEAHRNTCQWIYSDPEVSQKPWSNFREWLTRGQGCYWINGKAGSGKSTLMKYIRHDSQTKEALSAWAGGHELVIASFFFWNLGSALQKSQGGLFRSLLHDVLDQHRHLIPIVLPELCRAVTKLEGDGRLSDPSLSELRKGFRNLIHNQSRPLRICFLIDGIDEYEGDHSEISELLASVSSSSYVKIILSSRPISACVNAFSHCPSLRLQDLTHEDIKLYVEDKLKAKLDARAGLQTTEIIAELVEKASGVFIWVVLAVRSVLNGLQNHDRIGDLRRRLEELPADLKELYSHMVRRMPPIYRQQASELFQLVLKSVEVQTEDSITALQLSFAEESAEYAVAAPIREVTTKEESVRAEEVEGRIRSRCCGLLEMQEVKPQRRLLSSMNRPTVGFLHKTVVEFLRDPSVWDDMLSLTAGSHFDPTIALLRSCLLLTKSLPTTMTIKMESSLAWQSMQNCIEYCVLAEDSDHRWLARYLDELDTSMSRHWESAWKFSTSGQSCQTKGHWAIGQGLVGEMWNSKTQPDSFLSLAIVRGLAFYVNEKLSGNYVEGVDQYLNLALRCFILTWDDSPTTGQRSLGVLTMKYAQIVEFLLQNGADPNKGKETEPTTWELALEHLVNISSKRDKFVQDFVDHGHGEVFAKLLVCLIMSGAEPNANVVFRKKRYRDQPKPLEFRRSALAIVEHMLGDSNFSLTVSRPKAYSSAQTYRERLAGLLIERGAKSREWVNKELIAGPTEKEDGSGKTILSRLFKSRSRSPGLDLARKVKSVSREKIAKAPIRDLTHEI
jgi:hypothetical protein